MPSFPNTHDTIVSLSTPQGTGAIALIRLSGASAISIFKPFFFGKGKKNLAESKGHTVHFGKIMDGEDIIDEVLVTIFKEGKSYTGEETVEISCHASLYIQQKILQQMLMGGARMANPGEYTMRAFLNGKMDLSQAEAVADLIASTSEAAHRISMHQLRGGFSSDIHRLRENLIDFAALIELELDFSEEDVEFADRSKLIALLNEIRLSIQKLIHSFSQGNAIKNGIPVVIIGDPNAGKSTLLNTLLNEDKAIVSEIAGTTRDSIEDEIVIGGILFRLTDTAGLRQTNDTIEALGISRTYQKIRSAAIVAYIFDINCYDSARLEQSISSLKNEIHGFSENLILIGNKADGIEEQVLKQKFQTNFNDIIFISAKYKFNIDLLNQKLLETANLSSLSFNETIVVNSRHFDALHQSLQALEFVENGIKNNISGEFLAADIRKVLFQLGTITGKEISNDDLLGSIFSKFCIGK